MTWDHLDRDAQRRQRADRALGAALGRVGERQQAFQAHPAFVGQRIAGAARGGSRRVATAGTR